MLVWGRVRQGVLPLRHVLGRRGRRGRLRLPTDAAVAPTPPRHRFDAPIEGNICCPLNVHVSKAASRKDRRVAKPRTKRPAVLIAEDEPNLRALAELIIADLGYITFSAANAKEALALFDEGHEIVLLFTDINMPDPPDGIDGLELARRAAELRAGLRVIYTTGGALTDGMTALFVEEASFLKKPYTREQLIEAVQGRETADGVESGGLEPIKGRF